MEFTNPLICHAHIELLMQQMRMKNADLRCKDSKSGGMRPSLHFFKILQNLELTDDAVANFLVLLLQ